LVLIIRIASPKLREENTTTTKLKYNYQNHSILFLETEVDGVERGERGFFFVFEEGGKENEIEAKILFLTFQSVEKI
jgi:hypothetical protein